MSASASLGSACALTTAPGTACLIFSGHDGSASGASNRIVKLIGYLQPVHLPQTPVEAVTRHRNRAPVPPVLSGRDQVSPTPFKADRAPPTGADDCNITCDCGNSVIAVQVGSTGRVAFSGRQPIRQSVIS